MSEIRCWWATRADLYTPEKHAEMRAEVEAMHARNNVRITREEEPETFLNAQGRETVKVVYYVVRNAA